MCGTCRRSESSKCGRWPRTPGWKIIGLHWLLAKTEGFYLTSPDPTVRRRTADYLQTLAEVCADLGGKIMVLGSPKQRNLLPGVSYDDAEAYAVEVLHAAIADVQAVRRHDRPRTARAGRRRLHAHRRGGHPAGEDGRLAATASCTST